MAAFGRSHRPRLSSFWWPPTPPVLAANREAAGRRARLPVWHICGTQSRRRDHVTASPQIRDMSVSGGQGTDNAEVAGSTPASPTNPWYKATFISRWAQQSHAAVAVPHRWVTLGSGVLLGLHPDLSAQFLSRDAARSRPRPTGTLWDASDHLRRFKHGSSLHGATQST